MLTYLLYFLFYFFKVGNGIQDCSDGSDETSASVKWWMLAIAVLVLSSLAIFTSFATRVIADQVTIIYFLKQPSH